MNIKKVMAVFLFLFSAAVFPKAALAHTVITAPVDSRPVSNTYLKKLAAIHSDSLYTVSADVLDLFTGSASDHFADSAGVRKQILSYTDKNDNSDTAVILNMSTYITGGLIGSRCAANYVNTDSALNELSSLTDRYKNPKYYVVLAMPRNLPETRGQKIWPDDKPLAGIGYFYVNRNGKNDYISANFASVTPSQFLMEYGYVYNKRSELGRNKLSPWEKDYIDYVEKNYVNNPSYSLYIRQYITPFKKTASLAKTLLQWQKSGRIDEVVFGNDDLQAPEFISYAFSNLDKSWIPAENQSPVKYSFSRAYMSTDSESVKNSLINIYSKNEYRLALAGKSTNANFIFGMDEIPQLVYARFLSQKSDAHAEFNIVSNSAAPRSADYDVLAPSSLINNTVSFVSAQTAKSAGPISVFVCDYGSGLDVNGTCKKIYAKTEPVSLIELYTNDTVNGKNEVFKTLLNNAETGSGYKGIFDLASFSAWNTNANAIGLGIAQSEVYMLSLNQSTDTAAFAKAQQEVLLQHVLDDGLYIANERQLLRLKNYIPSASEMQNSEKLKAGIYFDTVKAALCKSRIDINGGLYQITDVSAEKIAFPWKRIFDCEADVSVTLAKTQTPS